MKSQVLIVGAGPTGLVLALWLAKAGVPFRIVEKNAGPGEASRAMAVQARTLEFYRQCEIADEIVRSGIEVRGIHLRSGSRAIAGFRFGDIGSDISPFPIVLSLPQDDHERLLGKFLAQAGVQIEWNTALVRFTDTGDSVHAVLQKGGNEETGEFAYLCGCDGAHSITRQQLAMHFPGGTYHELFYVADVQATGSILTGDVNACIARQSFVLAFPVRSTGMYRLIGVVPRELAGRENLSFDDIRPYVRQQVDVEVTGVNWFSTYHVHHRVADHFRQGRVFIAGDASHIHSPAGGQGMNTGIGDAVNLAWKLAGVILGRCKPAILDTYEVERIAFARVLVKTTDRIFQAIVGRGVGAKLFRGVFLGKIAPLLLRFRAVRRAQFRLVSQTRINYRKSELSAGKAGKIAGGDRLPWLESQDNFRPLNSLAWQVHVYGTAGESLRQFAGRQKLPLHSFDYNAAAEKAGLMRDGMYLVRPDGYVALAQADQNIQPLEQFCERWFTVVS